MRGSWSVSGWGRNSLPLTTTASANISGPLIWPSRADSSGCSSEPPWGHHGHRPLGVEEAAGSGTPAGVRQRSSPIGPAVSGGFGPPQADPANTGRVTDACYDRHRHEEFLDFLRRSPAPTRAASSTWSSTTTGPDRPGAWLTTVAAQRAQLDTWPADARDQAAAAAGARGHRDARARHRHDPRRPPAADPHPGNSASGLP